MRDDFARLSGHPVDDDDLRASIAVYNDNRAALRDLYRERSRRPWVFPLSEVYLLLRAGNVLPPEEHTQMLRAYLRQAPLDSSRREQDQSRVVLVGMFCEQPPHGLVVTLERAGCSAVDDDLLLGLRWLTRDVALDGDPLANLVEAYLSASVSTASRYSPDGDRARWLLDSVKRNSAPRASSSARRASAIRRCSTSRCSWPPSTAPASRTPSSSTPRTPASSP